MADLSEKDVVELRQSWALVAGDAEAVTDLFYGRLFDLDPQVRELFAGTDMAAQGHRLAAALSAVVAAADELSAAVPMLQELGARHGALGVRGPDYDTVGRALLWTLERGLGERFRPETKAAWSAAYAIVAGTMMEGARRKAA